MLIPLPPAEDDQVRRTRDLQRQVQEQAAARSLEASTIGSGGLVVKDGGSIRVEAPGTIDLEGGAFSAATLTATGVVQGGGLVSTGGASVAGALGAGSVVATGAVSAGGSVSAGGEVYAAGKVRGGNIWGNILSVDYRVVYVSNPTGELGHVPSSLRYKTCVKPAVLDLDAVLGLDLKTFKYKQAIEAYGSVEAAPTELGLIAEEVDEAGLGFLVYRGENGEVDGVAYERLALPLLAIVQHQQRQIDDQAQRLSTLEAVVAQLQ